MKKIILSAVLLASFTFMTSCKKDDDAATNLTCEEATAALAAVNQETSACDYVDRLKDLQAACPDSEIATDATITAAELLCNPLNIL